MPKVTLVPGIGLGYYTTSGYLSAALRAFPDIESFQRYHTEGSEPVALTLASENHKRLLRVKDLWQPMMADFDALRTVVIGTGAPSGGFPSQAFLDNQTIWPHIKSVVDGHLHAIRVPLPTIDLSTYIENSEEAVKVLERATEGEKLKIQSDGSCLPLDSMKRKCQERYVRFILEGLQESEAVHGRNFLVDMLKEDCELEKRNFDIILKKIGHEAGESTALLGDPEEFEKSFGNQKSFEENIVKLNLAILYSLKPKSQWTVPTVMERSRGYLGALYATLAARATRNAIALADATASYGITVGIKDVVYRLIGYESPSTIEPVQEPDTPEEVIATLESVVRRNPDDLDARQKLADCYLETQQIESAFWQLDECTTRGAGDETGSDLYSQLCGRQREIARNHEAVIVDMFDKCLKRHDQTKARSICDTLAALYEERTEYDKVVSIRKKFLQVFPDSMFERWQLVRFYRARGDVQKALLEIDEWSNRATGQSMQAAVVNELSEVLIVEPNNITALKLLFAEYLKEKSLDKAAPIGRQLVKIHRGAQEFEKAAEVLQAIIQVIPSDLSFREDLASVYEEGRQPKKAVSILLEVGKLAFGRRHFDEASSAYRKVLQHEPNHEGALAGSFAICVKQRKMKEAGELADQLSAIYAGSGKLREAVEVYESLLTIDPNQTAAHEKIAAFYEQAGQMKEAEAELLTAARLYSAKKLDAGAVKAYKKIITMDPANIDARLELAALYLEQKNPDAAIGQLEEIRSRDPNSGKAAQMLARAHALKGDAGSLTLLRDSLRHHPDSRRESFIAAENFLDRFQAGIADEGYPVAGFPEVVKTLLEAQTPQGFRSKNFLKTPISRLAKAVKKDPNELLRQSGLSGEESEELLTRERLQAETMAKLNRAWIVRLLKAARSNHIEKISIPWVATKLAHDCESQERIPDFWKGLALLSKALGLQ